MSEPLTYFNVSFDGWSTEKVQTAIVLIKKHGITEFDDIWTRKGLDAIDHPVVSDVQRTALISLSRF